MSCKSKRQVSEQEIVSKRIFALPLLYKSRTREMARVIFPRSKVSPSLYSIVRKKPHGAQRVGLCAGRNSCSTARLGRNFLVHGQNTTARSELKLLNILILSPGWRKAHVVRNTYLNFPVLRHSFKLMNESLTGS